MLALIVIVGTETLYRQPLFEYSIPFIADLQNYLNFNVFIAFKSLTSFGYAYAGVTFFVFVYCLASREKAFYILFVVVLQECFNQELKLVYHSPRPYFVGPDIIPYFSCSKSFGNPSSHCSFAACFYLTLFLILFHELPHESKSLAHA
jgi:membrane-associated phospholipid phosphatase